MQPRVLRGAYDDMTMMRSWPSRRPSELSQKAPPSGQSMSRPLEWSERALGDGISSTALGRSSAAGVFAAATAAYAAMRRRRWRFASRCQHKAAATGAQGAAAEGQNAASNFYDSAMADMKQLFSDDGSEPGSSGTRQPFTLTRLFRPVVLTFLASLLLYPLLAQTGAALLDGVAQGVVKGDVSQFMQNFFNCCSLLFSFFISQTYTFLYQQQESIYFALFSEISEARSLLEQLTLIASGRSNYKAMLMSMKSYSEELVQGLRTGCPPAALVAAKPICDPLENILYLTSVGMPSVVYDTVRSLRQARGARLGATQRKLPKEHFLLLDVLGALVLVAFPLLGAGLVGYEAPSQGIEPGHLLWLQSIIFAVLASGVVLALQVIQDLRYPTSGIYSVDEALEELVGGLQREVDLRMNSRPPDDPLAVIAGAPSGVLEEEEAAGLRSAALSSSEVAEDMAAWQRSESFQPQREGPGLEQRLGICAAFGVAAAILFILTVELLRFVLSKEALQAIREDNNAQWLQNFFTGIGLVFSLFAAQTFGFLYTQQEAIYLALYSEVSEAKALLEQLSLVCRGRSSYAEMLRGLQRYVAEDLQRFDCPPSRLLVSGWNGTEGDPLEAVLYGTSVGEPSAVYDTVRSLRQARAERLGAAQRKLPDLHFMLLVALAALELTVFPVLAAGCSALDTAGGSIMPGHITFFQACLFGLLSGAIALTVLVLWDLWSPLGDTYSIKTILAEMVKGLEEELAIRLAAAESSEKSSTSSS